MIAEKLLYLPPKLQVVKQEREEYRALLRENQLLAGPILLPGAAVCISMNPGHLHLEMGRQHSILENKGPVSDIAVLLPESQIAYGFTGGSIDALVSTGSALSNLSARILDGHAETLERVRRAAFGSFLTEFDASRKNVVSYIEGEKVREPWRVIVDECNRKQAPIFEPELDKDGIPKYDALTVKVLRSRIGAPTILKIEGWGPAGTVYGFKLLLKDRKLLLELSKWASRWGSFEVVFLVKGVGVEKDLRGRKSMVAKGPLVIVDCRPIQEVEGGVDIVRAAFETSARPIPVRKNIFCFPAVEDRQLALRVQEDYNRGDKNAVIAKPLPRDNDMEREKFGEKIDTVISDELKKTEKDFRGKISDLSDEERIEIFREVMSATREIFDARLVRRRTLDEFYSEKYQGLAKKEGVVFESQPKPKEPLTPPDLSQIPLWQGRKKDGMPLEFIRNHYGQWLSAFGAEEDRVFQDQIRARDPGLIKGVHNQCREENKDRRLRDFVKTRSARVDRELESVSVEDLKENPHLATTLYWRGRRAAERQATRPGEPVIKRK